jgi:hypothetical protein
MRIRTGPPVQLYSTTVRLWCLSRWRSRSYWMQTFFLSSAMKRRMSTSLVASWMTTLPLRNASWVCKYSAFLILFYCFCSACVEKTVGQPVADGVDLRSVFYTAKCLFISVAILNPTTPCKMRWLCRDLQPNACLYMLRQPRWESEALQRKAVDFALNCSSNFCIWNLIG